MHTHIPPFSIKLDDTVNYYTSCTFLTNAYKSDKTILSAMNRIDKTGYPHFLQKNHQLTDGIFYQNQVCFIHVWCLQIKEQIFSQLNHFHFSMRRIMMLKIFTHHLLVIYEVFMVLSSTPSNTVYITTTGISSSQLECPSMDEWA